MKKFDIEAYLEGGLSQEERDAFEQELRQNPAFAHAVEAQRKVSQLLRTQLLRERVTSVLAEKAVHRRTRRWFWVPLCTLLIFLVGYFFFFRETPGNRQHAAPKIEGKSEAQPAPVQGARPDTTILEEKTTPEKPQPIAEGKPDKLPLPEYPSPNVRGQGESNTAWKAMLDKVWYTQLPPNAVSFKTPFTEAVMTLVKRDFEDAFVQLEMLEAASPENDTLRLLKGYCLLEMGEGGDALRYFQHLEKTQPSWKAWLEWHQGLALLLSGKAEMAVPKFRKIASSPNHPFRREGQRALEVLE